MVEDGVPLEEPLDEVVSIERLVDAGLSAQLGSESFVTGQLLVELDFRTDARGEMYGGTSLYPEIPSVPSDIQQAIARFQNLVADIEQNVDFAALSERVFSLLQGLDELANSRELRDAISGLDALINAEETQRVPVLLTELADEMKGTVRDAGELLDRLDSDTGEVAGELKDAVRRLNSAMATAEAVLRGLQRHTSGESAQMYQLRSTLEELEDAARSARDFFDYLERHPEALIRGKQP